MTRTLERSSGAMTRHQEFLKDVLTGLGRARKRLSCRFFYDERGSKLFDQICELEEYYLTRTETAIMENSARDMAEQIGTGVRLVEFGSGSSRKTRILLDRLIDPAAYVPVDISFEHLHNTAEALAKDYPHLEVLPVCAGFLPGYCSALATAESLSHGGLFSRVPRLEIFRPARPANSCGGSRRFAATLGAF